MLIDHFTYIVPQDAKSVLGCPNNMILTTPVHIDAFWHLLMVKSLSIMWITYSDFPMSSITGRANLLLTTSYGGGVYAGIKMPA
ncbi:hypothetical protein KB20921_15580 [Edwardsiella ictaluri]|nr:hypothetical protein KH20906_15310 [Edwardsiella ictaluri]BEI02297.1 hypothetical protein KB20921_15580 [Edwardsiella ictaluri]BEI05765.1 hypothetical protein KH201010_15510 [Edwardsiella ictaluri]BEI09220.1 hypothetical protein STU22726_15510 [Edwardsiella ictaluri]BEI12700.1 hypothetical protein STU22816_15530 [Edwardsiella ictaluri]